MLHQILRARLFLWNRCHVNSTSNRHATFGHPKFCATTNKQTPFAVPTWLWSPEDPGLNSDIGKLLSNIWLLLTFIEKTKITLKRPGMVDFQNWLAFQNLFCYISCISVAGVILISGYTRSWHMRPLLLVTSGPDWATFERSSLQRFLQK